MARYSRLTTLEDAYFFLHCSTSLPALPSSGARQQRFLRAAVLIAWTAVEDGINNLWHENGVPGKPPRELKRRVIQLFKHLRILTPDWHDFEKRKRLRNKINHPPAGSLEVILTEADAHETLLFCRSILRTLYPDLILWKEWEFNSGDEETSSNAFTPLG
jgi:hypothetical protein